MDAFDPESLGELTRTLLCGARGEPGRRGGPVPTIEDQVRAATAVLMIVSAAVECNRQRLPRKP